VAPCGDAGRSGGVCRARSRRAFAFQSAFNSPPIEGKFAALRSIELLFRALFQSLELPWLGASKISSRFFERL
jgi:hypothetical protein